MLTFIGAVVLYLLERNHTSVSFVDAYFIAVSAMCVTGLSLVRFSEWYLASQVGMSLGPPHSCGSVFSFAFILPASALRAVFDPGGRHGVH